MPAPGAETRMLVFVAQCDDAAHLRTIAANAQAKGAGDLVDAARRRLYAILPAEAPGTLEHDVWQSIHALEDALRDERGKTVRLSRTRQKIVRDGELRCIADLLGPAETDGFRMLEARGMLEYSFEAVALRHADRFDEDLLALARTRLAERGQGAP